MHFYEVITASLDGRTVVRGLPSWGDWEMWIGLTIVLVHVWIGNLIFKRWPAHQILGWIYLIGLPVLFIWITSYCWVYDIAPWLGLSSCATP